MRAHLPISCQIAYIPLMRIFPRPQPASAMTDVIRALRAPVPHKLGIMGVSAAITYVLIMSLVNAFTPKPVHHSPEIIYVKQWPKSRTLAQVKAQQAIDGPIEKAAAEKELADEKAYEENRRAQFKRAQEILSHYGVK